MNKIFLIINPFSQTQDIIIQTDEGNEAYEGIMGTDAIETLLNLAAEKNINQIYVKVNSLGEQFGGTLKEEILSEANALYPNNNITIEVL